MRKIGEKHPQYEQFAAETERARDFGGGQERVKAAESKYLSTLEGHKSTSDPAYQRLLKRAWLYEGTAKTVEALVGLLFRHEPTFESIPSIQSWFDDVDGCGNDLSEWVAGWAPEVVNPGRIGILTDYPSVSEEDGSSARNLAQAEEMGQRAFSVTYAAENIWDWQLERVRGSAIKRLTRVVLHEPGAEGVEIVETDEGEQHGQLRELRLNDEGVYEQALYEWKNGDWVEFQVIEPKANRRQLDRLTFRFANWRDATPQMRRPLLMPLVNVEASWYSVNADYESGLFYCGRPQPVITWGEQSPVSIEEDGPASEADEAYVIGSETAWELPYGSTAEFLEFKGAGMSAIKDNLEAKEQKMAILGARMLMPERRQVEAADTARIHRMGESGSLARIAKSIEDTVMGVAEDVAAFHGTEVPQDWRYTMNREFLPRGTDPTLLRELNAMYLDGSISFETLMWNLEKAEVREAGKSVEQELEEIESGRFGGSVSVSFGGSGSGEPVEDEPDEDAA